MQNWKHQNQITLANGSVLLTPISMDDVAAYSEIALDPQIWTYFVSRVRDHAEASDFVSQAVTDWDNGTRFVYTIRDTEHNVLGSSAFGSLAESDRRLEIGWSWLAPQFQGRDYNAWAKYSLLCHAFDTLQCERVEFKTDVLNKKAMHGLERIGATREGVFRSFNYMPDGRRRDAVYYSIIRAEWPQVKTALYERAQAKTQQLTELPHASNS